MKMPANVLLWRVLRGLLSEKSSVSPLDCENWMAELKPRRSLLHVVNLLRDGHDGPIDCLLISSLS